MTKILVIEDEPTILENIIETLQLEDYEAYGASNGLEGVQRARQLSPDLIICDIMMPELDGYEVFIELHSDPATSSIPFIFLTAKADYMDIRRGMELGADDYLTKPFMPVQLLKAIQTRIQRQEQIRQDAHKKIEDMRNRIIYTLPHELRTPLTGVLGNVALLLEDYETIDRNSLYDMLKSVNRSAQRLHRLIENYLLFAQLDLKNVRGSAFAYAEVLDAALTIRQCAQAKAATVKRESDLVLELEKGCLLIADDDFKKIIEELLDNAFKFSVPGTQVKVSHRVNGAQGVLSVSNAGRGMTPEQIEALGAYIQFERVVYEQQGSGLGLIIAKRLAESYKGQVNIESVPGQSLTVNVSIPICEGG